MVDKIIKNRKSVQNFSKKKPDWRDIIKAIDLARHAPMAGNVFSPRFILVNDKTKIKKLIKATQQDFFSNVDYVVVVCSNTSKTLNMYPERGERDLRKQVGAAITNFLLKLEDLGLNTSWVGHFVDEQIKKIFKIPGNIQVEAIFPIGYENHVLKTNKKRKINLDNILYFNEFKNKRMKK